MKLHTLCFEGDYALEKREKEKSNYCYANGDGVRKNVQQADASYAKAAEQEHDAYLHRQKHHTRLS